MHHSADLGHMAIHVRMGCGIARWSPFTALAARNHVSIEITEHKICSRELVIRNPRRLDDEQIAARYAAGDVASSPHDKTCAD
ncbi:hypothetical protein GCM10009692_13760 [Leucobacter aridicollis]